MTANEMVEDALREIKVLREDEAVEAGDLAFAMRKLNRIVKRWQNRGLLLWTKETATIFLQKNQREYLLNSTGAHATLDFTKTSLFADYATGISTIKFNDSITGDIAVNDAVGIALDTNFLQWTTVASIVDPETITINDVLTSGASEDKVVYIYTTKLDQPFNVYSAVRVSDSEIDTEMNYLSYEDYFRLPNKTTQATPVSYNYDRQLDSARIVVWPTPIDLSYRMQITMSRRVQDFDGVTNNPDLPQEWIDTIILNLAVALGPSFGKASSPNFAQLKIDAKESLAEALMHDNESGSLTLQPDFYN